MASILKLVTIGNSQGVRLPKALLSRYHFQQEIRAVETADGILLQPVEADKLSWEEGFLQSASENREELAAWEGTLEDGLEPEEFEGWPR
jgi:antitoxin MazE